MDLIGKFQDKCIRKKGISQADALELASEASGKPYTILAAASAIREHFKGKGIR